MALASTEVTPSSYVLIGDNITTITFQCQSNNPIVIGISTNNVGISTTAPGLIYKFPEGELKKNVTDLSHESGAAYVWAKALTGGTAKVVYEGA